MNTKLTLTIDKSIIENAKKYARKRDRSLSDLVENYLKILTDENTIQKEKTVSKVQKLKGAFKIPEDFYYKEELSKSLIDKYIK